MKNQPSLLPATADKPAKVTNKKLDPKDPKPMIIKANSIKKDSIKKIKIKKGSEIVKVGKYSIEITHADKILFGTSITKLDLVNYYKDVAPYMIPHVKNRPLMMHRYPNGINGKKFYQKNTPAYFPDWIETQKVALKERTGFTDFVVCQNTATLVYLASQAVITPHIWLSKIDNLHYPDKMIFDLDASAEFFKQICQVALKLSDILIQLGTRPYVMTTGSRGLHVFISLDRTLDFKESKATANNIAKILMQELPNLTTQEIRKAERGNKIFIDTLRNEFGSTSVAPYGVRAHPKAPVATPLDWDELNEKNLISQTYNISNIFDRLSKTGDLLKDFSKSYISSKKIIKLLNQKLNI